MMRKKVLIALVGLACFALTGCDAGGSGQGNNNSYVNEEDDMDNNVIQMTDEEKKILCSIYVNEDRINEGKLYDYQLEALNQFRSANDYLDAKYPGYDFEYFAFSPISKTSDVTKLEFTIDDTENYFTAQLIVEDDEYVITDNLAGYLLSPAYEKMLEEKFKTAGLDKFYVNARISGFYGKEVDANTSMDDIFSLGKSMKRDVEVYVDMPFEDETKKSEVVKTVEEEIRALNIYGAHSVYFVPGIMDECSSGDECLEYRKKNRLNFIQFNTFDL